MNTTLGIPLESFNLDEREYERSKVWSAVIKRYSTFEDDAEVDFDKLETEFADEKVVDDNIDDDDSTEVSLEDEENENNPLNHSVMQLHSLTSNLVNAQLRNGINGKCTSVRRMEPFNEADEYDDFDMRDMLDQTIPILADRERKWRESGMLDILNTFDEEKIERKVGSWLRINSSMQSANPTPNAQVQSHDDDDSLHSMDTARYVLSNRKPRSNNCSIAIKSYRLLQSKRDALREKYAFSEDGLEQELRQHVNGARNRNYLKAKTDCVEDHKLQQISRNRLGKAKKRKLLNKQRKRFCTTNQCCGSSSSSEENFKDESDEQYTTPFLKRQRRRLSASCSTSSCALKGKNAFLSSRFYGISANATRGARFKRHQFQALKPRQRASECCCFKEEKLCNLTEHLAFDTATDEWVVENCDSPKKLTSTERKIISEPKEIKATKTTAKKKKNATVDTQNKKDVERTVIDKKPKESTDKSLLESSFGRELQLAIELSKQTCETETKVTKGQCAESKTKNIKNNTKSKTKTKQSKSEEKLAKLNSIDQNKHKTKNNVEVAEIKSSDAQIIKNAASAEVTGLESIHQTQSKQQRKLFKKQNSVQIQTPQPIQVEKATEKESKSQELPASKQNKTLKRQSQVNLSQLLQAVDMSPSIIDNISPARFGLRPQPKSAKIKKIKKFTEKSHSATVTRNETFFSQADKICNSTAVATDVIASNKQISTKIIQSSIAATETASKTTDDVDCTIVSSTTDHQQQRKQSNATYTTNNHVNGDILLYTPHNRTLAPPHSYSDGVFNITEEHLSAVIGAKEARKFMKYYIGRRRFDANLSVYYRPPPRRLSHINSYDKDDETDSDVDALEQIDRLGDLYVLFDK